MTSTCQTVSSFLFLIPVVLILCVLGCSTLRPPDVEFVPTPHEVVAEMLNMAEVTQEDVVYDLGCGDGRIVIAAAKQYGARGVGVDIDPELIKVCRENARKAGVTGRVRFLLRDLFETELREATVVALYLTPELNLQLRPKLFRELKLAGQNVAMRFQGRIRGDTIDGSAEVKGGPFRRNHPWTAKRVR
jgi:SAM-dependent methyltransferase